MSGPNASAVPNPRARQRLRCAARGGMHGAHGAWHALLGRHVLMHAALHTLYVNLRGQLATQPPTALCHLVLTVGVVRSP